ncbi:MAG: AbrB family transcriptional regulator [Pseudomonadota bacterium]
MTGRSQAVRLPAAFRFDCDQVFVRKDPATGDVVLSKRPGSWGDFFDLVEHSDIPSDFMDDRDNPIEDDRDVF